MQQEIIDQNKLRELEQYIDAYEVLDRLNDNQYPPTQPLTPLSTLWASVALNILIDYPQIIQPLHREGALNEIGLALIEINEG